MNVEKIFENGPKTIPFTPADIGKEVVLEHSEAYERGRITGIEGDGYVVMVRFFGRNFKARPDVYQPTHGTKPVPVMAFELKIVERKK